MRQYYIHTFPINSLGRQYIEMGVPIIIMFNSLLPKDF